MELKTLSATIEIKKSLADAVEKGDKGEIAHAVAQAEKADFKDESLDKARLALENVDKLEAVVAELQAASSGQEQATIEAAIEKAEACGVSDDHEAMQHAKAMIKRLTKPETKVARLRSQTFVQRMQANSKKLRISRFPGLNGTGADAVTTTFTQEPIKRPMMRLGPDLAAMAIAQFVNILGYIGERQMTYPSMLALDMLALGLEKEELRDELYLQVMKQATNNSRDSVVFVWQLMQLMCRTFPPSDALYPYAQVFTWQQNMSPAPHSLRPALLIPQVDPGSHYRCGKRT